ncbi:MAG: aminotransferase class III-fold pyridoxal phosphate-dependent enzyme [Planctomycetota bacterium]
MTDPELEALLAARRAHLNPALSTAYGGLHVVSGRGSKLFDSAGNEYLDCVNNVCHAGHQHPRVVEALCDQARRLNTNTRYVYRLLGEYAERLADALPAPLDVVSLVNSGSEANDLALRMARAATGRTDVVVLDRAYHGHTVATLELSPYKFARGEQAPPHVHVAASPDPYRGEHRGDDTAPAYVASVEAAFLRAEARGGAAALFVEALQSCGGQIEPPAGYLAGAFRVARAHGALVVADEVQIGFGRMGSHRWGFETGDVVPDLVTLGKPIGNGHPLGAVVTTREVADAFARGPEYFNTYGGNPVACAVGLAVLEVLEEEGLQAHAAAIGDQLLAGFRALAARHAALGDVRGRGLFLGLELVTDREARTPAPDLARAIVETGLHRRVLLSRDGPAENVLKIKPPMVFDANDAERLLAALDEAFDALEA